MRRLPIFAILLWLTSSVWTPAAAQLKTPASWRSAAPRKQFVTVTLDGMNTVPLHFKENPLEELVGKELSEVHTEENIDYRSRDGLTTVDVIEYRRRTKGAGVMVYPLGMSVGPTLVLRASYESIPVTRVLIHQPDGSESYDLLDGKAFDYGAGVMVSDRSAGWGLGSSAFVIVGRGQLKGGDLGDGKRYYAEGGGGITFGPFGMQLAVKFARNYLDTLSF
jgi:hypothetical protein